MRHEGQPGASRAVTSPDRVADLSAVERAETRALKDAVYPPAEEASWPGATIEWAQPSWCVRVRSPAGALVSYVGVLLREGRYEGEDVLIGGIGGVKTHPVARRRGHAELALRRAQAFLRGRGDVAFGLLLCDAPLLDYYGRLGWREFSGRLLVAQRGRTIAFALDCTMTLPLAQPAPTSGTIDLCGPPW
jgi:hypothetical protein